MTEKEVLAANRERFAATVADDNGTLERLLADDLTLVHSSGRVETKSEHVSRTNRGYKSITSWDESVRLLGDVGIGAEGEHPSVRIALFRAAFNRSSRTVPVLDLSMYGDLVAVTRFDGCDVGGNDIARGLTVRATGATPTRRTRA